LKNKIAGRKTKDRPGEAEGRLNVARYVIRTMNEVSGRND
jgi:hypothetical protein